MEYQAQCEYDHLKIQNPATDHVDTFCGDALPEAVVVEDQFAKVMFKSDASMNKKGFRVVFSAVDPERKFFHRS